MHSSRLLLAFRRPWTLQHFALEFKLQDKDVSEANINDGDSQASLDERGTQEVLEIMRRERVKYIFGCVACSLLTIGVHLY
ncbi:hypothetical protein EV363DRAFT_304613 [Boletus edulis]|nr:hypothetical protein EV363DRAFT_304613 [Boletus edulis]